MAGLLVNRLPHEQVLIGDNIKITILECHTRMVVLRIEAPPELNIKRAELEQVKEKGIG